MQRLFTTFPNSWPGGGLLLLRLALSGSLVMTRFDAGGGASDIVLKAVAIASATMLLAGLWTPIISLLQFVLTIALLGWGIVAVVPGAWWLPVFLSLAMLGPGAWSVDAIRFGRRRMYVDPE